MSASAAKRFVEISLMPSGNVIWALVTSTSEGKPDNRMVCAFAAPFQRCVECQHGTHLVTGHAIEVPIDFI